ncbi:hypothetical protein GWI72_07225 [Microvirga tunisiensis]|uniref:O-antigen ligase-related domain-containing protein n=1 Tax=Pannonibacter tanglangensis TaxID=2750084 RepID=A0A7X5F3D8_9HYPH|nr:O-antigen ligase family protein [Pannonibacter sp. XCT-53]NBN78055.1 hypothetical protein [Pannonibacter sp. XCT-53]
MEDRSLHGNIDAHRHAHRQRNEMLILAYILFGLLALELHFLSSGVNIGNLIILSAVCIVGLLGSINRGLPFNLTYRFRTHDYIFLIYIAYTALTAFWSISFGDTITGVVPVFGLFLLAILISKIDQSRLIRCTLMFAVVAAVLSLVMMVVVPDLAFQPKSSTGQEELRGVFKHQLRLGAFMCVAAGFLVLAVLNGALKDVFFKRWTLRILGIALIFLVLYLSRTRLYVAAAILSLVLTVGLSQKGGVRWLTFAVIAYGALILSQTYEDILTYLEQIGFDTSLTARTLIWTRALAAITDQVYWLGFGYDSFINSHFDYLFRGNYRPSHAHNSFIQAHFETGMIGLLLLLLLVTVQFKAVLAARRQKRNRYSYAMFLFFFNLFGSLIGLNYAGALSVMFGLFIICLAIETRPDPAAVLANGNAAGQSGHAGSAEASVAGRFA